MKKNGIRSVEAAINRTIAILEAIYGPIARPSVIYPLRGTRTLGEAEFKKNQLRFHRAFLAENEKNYVEVVVPHEVCHLAAYQKFKDNGHGKAWKRMMRDVGLPALIQIPFNEKPVGAGTGSHLYHCPTCGLSAVLQESHHRRIQSGKSKWGCFQCGKPMKYRRPVTDQEAKFGISYYK